MSKAKNFMKMLEDAVAITSDSKMEFRESKDGTQVRIAEDKWANLPKGWTKDSLKSFWGSLTGDRKHKVSACMKKMDGKVSDPGAFCGGLASRLGER